MTKRGELTMKCIGIIGNLVLCVTLTLGACSQGKDTQYLEDWGAGELLAGGKADGLVDIAQPIVFDDEVSGFVNQQQLDLYRLDLLAGDQIKVEMTVTDGDLEPHTTLFYGSTSYISSENWEREGNQLLKWYFAEHAGAYLLAARAYQEQGHGHYTIKVTCEGGPCNGEHPEKELDRDEVDWCLTEAQVCAFSDMESGLDESGAQALLQVCLDGLSLDEGYTCSNTCSTQFEGDYLQPNELCQDIQTVIAYYSNQSEECVSTFESCLGACLGAEYYYGESYSYYDFWDTPMSICVSNGFNGNCNDYAQKHEDCGGEMQEDSIMDCFEWCWAIDGAWIDDLDTICQESCSDYCEEPLQICEEQCQNDSSWDCEMNCLEDLGAGPC